MDIGGDRARGSLPVRLAALLLVTALGAAAPAPAGQSGAVWREVTCAGARYRYMLYSPGRREAVPAIVLLHGAGGNPVQMVGAWRDLARQEGIALVAPELPLAESFEAVAPSVFRCQVEDAGRIVALDRSRTYVFGYSMGGYLAYDAGMLASRSFGAIAVVAMDISPSYDWIVDSAARKTPVAIYIGDRDPLVSLERVRRTRDFLRSRGFTVHYVELPGQDHDYFESADFVNPDAWAFLKQHVLASPGR